MLQPDWKSRTEKGDACGRRLHLVTSGRRETEAGEPEERRLANAEENGKPAMAAEDFAPAVLKRARAGDPEAFRAIFKRYGKPVAAFLYHLTGDRSRTEEMAQETFFRTFRGLHRLREGVKLSTWIFGIARNVAHESLREVRRSRREVGLHDGLRLTLQDDRSGPDEKLSGGEVRIAIRRALMDLPEDQRLVFVLKLLHKMRYQEISAIMRCSIGKLKTDLHRARQLMRERLRPHVARTISEM